MAKSALPSADRRDARVSIAVSATEKAIWTEAAARINGPGRPLTEYVRDIVSRQAARDIRRYPAWPTTDGARE